MIVFVTVGSTKFDALIESVLSADVLQSLQARGYNTLVVQCGDSQANILENTKGQATIVKNGVVCEVWRFKPSLEVEFERADLVISHAGSGTILEVLRRRKPLIVVPNSSLLDDHQQELANELSKGTYLVRSDVGNLGPTIMSMNPSELKEFPPFCGDRFRKIVDEEMGFC
ncbi:hypothetical protein ONZ45_g17245 [Pleurotus djamor]|nr:hypothetical protein ONZ45_g17245 [Pleurotus djamor]